MKVSKMKHDFKLVKELYSLPFHELLLKAHNVHLENWDPKDIQISSLLSIKTGSCPENCSYCPQSAHYNTGLKKEPLMDIESVIDAAKKAKEAGVDRFCLGAAWRGPKDSDVEKVGKMVEEIKKLGLETCVTLGLLKDEQAKRLKEYGLDYYNHNIDSSDDFYSKIITTRVFEDRIKTIENLRKHDIKVCCGGILGMGETEDDRVKMIVILANMDPYPESVPINKLIPIPGTPLATQMSVSELDFVRIIALARILMPKTRVRLSAGREDMSHSMQALCFFAGANSIFYGDKLLTANNNSVNSDQDLFDKLGLEIKTPANIDSLDDASKECCHAKKEPCGS